MIDSDAGKYEVKINYYGDITSATCNRNVLRMLEQTAVHAPVTFYLQQNCIQYKPEDIIELYFLHMNSLASSSHTITIHYTIDMTATLLYEGYPVALNRKFWKNGTYQSLNTDNVITERSYGSEK